MHALLQARDALADAEAGQDALQQAAHDSAAAARSLEQSLGEAQLELAAAHSQREALSSRVAELEGAVAARDADLQQARGEQLGAERHCANMQQQLEIAQAQVGRTAGFGGPVCAAPGLETVCQLHLVNKRALLLAGA